MSEPEQPPYGQQQPSYPAYPQPPAYGAMPPPKGTSGRTIGIIVASVVGAIVLFCGGAIGLVVWAIESTQDAIDDARNQSGGRDNPIEVTLGEEFDIGGMEFQEGWSLDPTSTSSTSIQDLRVENNREDEDPDSVSITVKFLQGDEILGQVRCLSAGQIGFEQSMLLDCSSGDQVDVGYDRITVNNSTYPDRLKIRLAASRRPRPRRFAQARAFRWGANNTHPQQGHKPDTSHLAERHDHAQLGRATKGSCPSRPP